VKVAKGGTLWTNASLSVKQERMPAGTSEALHYHEHAQQFFFILKGTATFEIDHESYRERTGRHTYKGRDKNIASVITQQQPLNSFFRRSHQRPATGSIYQYEKNKSRNLEAQVIQAVK
jgi:hypothetical protein